MQIIITVWLGNGSRFSRNLSQLLQLESYLRRYNDPERVNVAKIRIEPSLYGPMPKWAEC